MKIICQSKAKEPYASVISELSKRARVPIEFVKSEPESADFVLDQFGEEITVELLHSLIKPNSVFLVGGPDGTNTKGRKLSLGSFTLNHQIAIIVLLELLFRAKNPNHPYNKH